MDKKLAQLKISDFGRPIFCDTEYSLANLKNSVSSSETPNQIDGMRGRLYGQKSGARVSENEKLSSDN